MADKPKPRPYPPRPRIIKYSDKALSDSRRVEQEQEAKDAAAKWRAGMARETGK